MCVQPMTKNGNTFSCGKCIECHNRYLQHWIFRVKNELRKYPLALFVTLTYDYDNIKFDGRKFTLHKPDYQKFLKRLRKRFKDREIKYILCGEYGSKNSRPHYHALIFNVSYNDYQDILQAWNMGHVHVGTVEPASIAYVFKYAVKDAMKENQNSSKRRVKPFIVMSKGIGEEFAFNVQRVKITGIDKNGNRYVRYKKIRELKPHFDIKLKTYLQQPYYLLPKVGGGTVKMSIPRFYLKASNYDTTEYKEQIQDEMQKKYEKLTESQKQYWQVVGYEQRKSMVVEHANNTLHSISKEKL